MSRQIASEVVVLAEDERHQIFTRRYLYRLGLQRHALRFMPLSAGKGCGEQWVREQYAEAVRAYRTRSAHAKSALIVVIDSDVDTVEKRVEQLRAELAQAGLNSRTANEKIIHLIPKRNIETWILYLTGRSVDEETDYKGESAIDEKLKDAAEALFNLVHSNDVLSSDCPSSIGKAISELKRLG